MKWTTRRLEIPTRGADDVVDVTGKVQEAVASTGHRQGQVLVFVVGSTASVTTIEFEPGLCEDLPAALERIAPRDARYRHEERWHDDNGHSHVRASLLGPSLTVPFDDGRLLLGTWQQIVVVDSDTRPRKREIVIQVAGD